MMTDAAAWPDKDFSRLQMEVPGYIMGELEDEGSRFIRHGKCLPVEEMKWTGCLYRLWHCETGETSKQIYRQANASAVMSAYMEWRNLDGREVIGKLKEAYTIRKAGRTGRQGVQK
ncbi:MAG: hypothetical protein LUD51_07325 [Clostridia bacterium]|nr:hypothetical protein [Clostridia bacterium]